MRLYIVIALCYISTCAFSQRIAVGNSVIINTTTKEKNEKTRLTLSKTSPSVKEEYALYRNVIRKYTWLVGVGEPITQATASHLPFYFKLSKKNKEGNWQHVQAMHGSLMTSDHNISPYVMSKDEDTTNVWAEKIKTVTQWFFYSDAKGKDVVEERAYTNDGDMVYSFMPTKNKDGRVIGCYNDEWGLPVDMREDSTAYYGSVVRLTLDACGRDSIVDFLDGNGYRKYNNDGVDQQRFLYDDKDRMIMKTSHNMVGDYTIDNWGNCGVKYIYDSDNSLDFSILIVDDNLQPMRMPSLRSGREDTFIRCDVKFDKWGRLAERIMLDADGSPDQTTGGIARIVYNYDEKGKLLSKTLFAMDGSQLAE